ncbi:hypothetical protein DICPUDRAFT_156736 [Dictyostelium purpureum]|uniref:Uncharacterized protein n=1 Tax=Dictyostelium purpureum TaxID=5786 RepID=F0ZXA9_DICPU|nr:uncharacterized protein DICPUDRAFT_156736 [Dictyostelium purpureum]EGC31424.1 hypothetical protein DICPUDRAFT_156736 [Dictyostelium purpureum]|eukprot:XP_003292057.1 hypothetical protein DICPUDRAFT_156736 [Dictyostelium purpureum]
MYLIHDVVMKFAKLQRANKRIKAHEHVTTYYSPIVKGAYFFDVEEFGDKIPLLVPLTTWDMLICIKTLYNEEIPMILEEKNILAQL